MLLLVVKMIMMSCDSFNETRCDGSVGQCSMESVLSFSLSSENNPTNRNLNNRLDIKTMAPVIPVAILALN